MILRAAKDGWMFALAAVLYFLALFASAATRRYARAAGPGAQDDGGPPTDEN